MKKIAALLLTLLLFWTIAAPAFGSVDLDPQKQYGMPLDFKINHAYPGKISIDGIFVYKDSKDYVFTILYSGGELVKQDNAGHKTVKSSFFNPPSGDILKISWINDFKRISSDNKKIQYRADAEKLRQCREITIFLYDALFANDDQNISCYFSTAAINFDKVPSVQDLINGYEFTSDKIEADMNEIPSSWAQKGIEELKLSEVFRDSAFSSYNSGITRARFVYLMVRLYEKLTGLEIPEEGSVSFTDTSDIYSLKAAHIGITKGIGNNKFGPDILLNREQMATFVVRTMELAKLDLSYTKEPVAYGDDGKISGWAKDAIYTALHYEIIGGVGGNRFSPETVATNEQALTIVHRLMRQYGGLRWYEEKDHTRFFLRFSGELYNIPFAKDIVLDSEMDKKDIYFESLEDVNIFLNLSQMDASRLSCQPTANPNFAGILKVYDYNFMDSHTENIYFGVDKTGEFTRISFKSKFSKEMPEASITVDNLKKVTSYNGFQQIHYYDRMQVRNSMHVLPTKEIFEQLGITYTLEYNDLWDIYIVEFARQ